jgi:peroxiredoxin
MTNLLEVDWSEIPAPTDDGAASHLIGQDIASVRLMGTDGESIDLSMIEGLSVVYVYPMTGGPNTPLPDGWDMLPGARGCTPQSCSFRDHANELEQLGVTRIFGLSTQDSEYQREAVDRLHLPFQILSDATLLFATAMNLPTFEVEGMTLLKRLTMILHSGTVKHVFYPVFPPDQNAKEVITWLTKNQVSYTALDCSP